MSRSKPLIEPRDDKKDLYLEDKEVKLLIKTAGLLGRHCERDAAMIQLAYSHGLRASEVCRLKWQDVNLEKETIYCYRVKGSKSGQHPLYPHDIRVLKKLGKQVGFVFKSEAIASPGPVSVRGFHLIVARAGKECGLGSFVHPHQLRHACGHRLREEDWSLLDIQEFLGHRNPQNTAIYAQADAGHFRRLIKRGQREHQGDGD